MTDGEILPVRPHGDKDELCVNCRECHRCRAIYAAALLRAEQVEQKLGVAYDDRSLQDSIRIVHLQDQLTQATQARAAILPYVQHLPSCQLRCGILETFGPCTCGVPTVIPERQP